MIVASAIRLDELVFSMPAPARHHHLIAAIFDLTGKTVGGRYEQGFVNDHGCFRDRESAMREAIVDGQVQEGKTFQPLKLFSEDLW